MHEGLSEQYATFISDWAQMLKKIIAAVKGISEGRAWQKEFDGKAPKAGARAPDFGLSDVNGENPIRVSQFFGQRPIVLVFGSFS